MDIIVETNLLSERNEEDAGENCPQQDQETSPNTDLDISDNQFMFLVEHSTICAIENAVKYAHSAIFLAAIATAVSICHNQPFQLFILEQDPICLFYT